MRNKRIFIPILAAVLFLSAPFTPCSANDEPPPSNTTIVVPPATQPTDKPTEVKIKAEVDMNHWSPASLQQLFQWLTASLIPTLIGMYALWKSHTNSGKIETVASNTTQLNQTADPGNVRRRVDPMLAEKTARIAGTGTGNDNSNSNDKDSDNTK